jgi:hypothetical protein
MNALVGAFMAIEAAPRRHLLALLEQALAEAIPVVS